MPVFEPKLQLFEKLNRRIKALPAPRRQRHAAAAGGIVFSDKLCAPGKMAKGRRADEIERGRIRTTAVRQFVNAPPHSLTIRVANEPGLARSALGARPLAAKIGSCVRVVNVLDLMTLQPKTEHPHGLADNDFDSLFTK